QHARLEVAHAAEGIDEVAVGVLGDGVDGEVAALEVLFEGDGRVGVDDETAVARRALAFGARERVFLAGLGMQEHGEIAADGAEGPATGRAPRRRRGRFSSPYDASTPQLLPPLAGEGWDGGDVRCDNVERGDLKRPPPRPSPASGGRGRGLNLLAAHLLLPPLAGEGWDGGSVRRETVERGDLMRPPPRPSPAGGGGGCIGGR